MAQLNISEAARHWGVSRQTLYTYRDQGKITFGQDEKGNPIVDSAELVRVFGEPPQERTAAGGAGTMPENSRMPSASDEIARLQLELNTRELKSQIEIERLKRESAEQIADSLRAQINRLEAMMTEKDRQLERTQNVAQEAMSRVPAPMKRTPLLDWLPWTK